MNSDQSDIPVPSVQSYSTIQPSNSNNDSFAFSSDASTQPILYRNDSNTTSDEIEDDNCDDCCDFCGSCMESCSLTLNILCCCCILAECLTQLKWKKKSIWIHW